MTTNTSQEMNQLTVITRVVVTIFVCYFVRQVASPQLFVIGTHRWRHWSHPRAVSFLAFSIFTKIRQCYKTFLHQLRCLLEDIMHFSQCRHVTKYIYFVTLLEQIFLLSTCNKVQFFKTTCTCNEVHLGGNFRNVTKY